MVVFDLEGSGAQDREHEAILEVGFRHGCLLLVVTPRRGDEDSSMSGSPPGAAERCRRLGRPEHLALALSVQGEQYLAEWHSIRLSSTVCSSPSPTRRGAASSGASAAA